MRSRLVCLLVVLFVVLIGCGGQSSPKVVTPEPGSRQAPFHIGHHSVIDKWDVALVPMPEDALASSTEGSVDMNFTYIALSLTYRGTGSGVPDTDLSVSVIDNQGVAESSLLGLSDPIGSGQTSVVIPDFQSWGSPLTDSRLVKIEDNYGNGGSYWDIRGACGVSSPPC